MDKDTFDNNEDCPPGPGCSGTLTSPQEGKVVQAVQNCADAQNKPGWRVIMTGTLDNWQCNCQNETAGVTDPGNYTIVTRPGMASDGIGVVAHELGHAMGIKWHNMSNQDLMYATTVSGSPLLLDAEDCDTARFGAQYLQDTVWPPP